MVSWVLEKQLFFRSLLSQSKRKDISVCAIVNDMSELDVDGELISNSAIVEKDEKYTIYQLKYP